MLARLVVGERRMSSKQTRWDPFSNHPFAGHQDFSPSFFCFFRSPCRTHVCDKAEVFRPEAIFHLRMT